MLYMIVERFAGNDLRPVYRHLRAHGRGLPDGLSFVASWVESDHSRCFQLMETDDRALIDKWIEHWEGTGVTFEEVVPVVTGVQAQALVEGGSSAAVSEGNRRSSTARAASQKEHDGR